jgi:hypothetical protein
MQSAKLERHAMECLLLAREVPDPQQRQTLWEIGLSLLQVAEQVKQNRHQETPVDREPAASSPLHRSLRAALTRRWVMARRP